ncbi:MAG: aldo/keto reductase [Gammaproteobacteria bacterium]|nr:aldo/keto reductase [Gammaproteobacteria bacterium]
MLGSILKSGVKMPLMGLGTDGFKSLEALPAFLISALDRGVTMVDTATGYGSHAAVASALQARRREDLFVCSKFHSGNLFESGGAVDVVVKQILTELKIDYLDQLLIHNPAVIDNFPDTLKALIPLKEAGLIKSIGVSNFTVKYLNKLGADLAHVDVNQVEFHPYLNQIGLAEFCKSQGIRIMAYRPLCEGGELLADARITKIAEAREKTPAQIILRWLVQQEMTPVVRTSSLEHLAENWAAFDFELTKSEMDIISGMNRGYRSCTGPWARFDDLVAEASAKADNDLTPGK